MRYVVLVIGLCGVASAALLARLGLEAGVSATGLTAWRLTFASFGLLGYEVLRPDRMRLAKAEVWKASIAGVFLAAHFATWIASLAYTSVALSTLLVSTSPLWTGLIGFFIPSLKPKPVFWIGLAVAGCGTALISISRPIPASQGPPWLGYVLATVGAICVVPYLLLSQGVQKRVGTVTTITWIYSVAAVAAWTFLLAHREFPRLGSANAWLSVIGMTLFAQLLGHGLINFSLQKFTAAQISASTLLEPVFAGLLAWIVIGERVPALQVIGGAILLGGVALSLTGEAEPQPVRAD